MRTLLQALRPGSVRVHPAEVVSLAGWLLALAIVEGLGRGIQTDAGDALIVAGLGVLAAATYAGHRRYDLFWTQALARVARGLAHRTRALEPTFGLDLRGSPPLPRAVPWLHRLAGPVALLLTGWLWWHRESFPHGLHTAPAPLYLLRLAGLVALWGALVAGSLLGLACGLGWVHDRALATGRGSTPVDARPWAVPLAVFLLGAGAALLLPVTVPVVAISVTSLVAMILLLFSPAELELVWRDKRGGIRATAWGRTALSWMVVGACLGVAPTILTRGEDLFTSSSGSGATMPVTEVLGSAYAWCASLVLCAVLSGLVRLQRRRRSFVMAACAVPRVRIEGEALTTALRAALYRAGWRVSSGEDPAAPGEVIAHLDSDALPADPLFGPSWPRRVCPDWLASPEGLSALARRRTRTLRRKLLRGLRRAWKRAATREFQRGQGFWLAPHYWFVSGLTRDVPEGDHHPGEPVFDDRVGPAFEHVLPWAARVHFHRLMSDLEIDLVFVEDGLGWRKVAAFLRTLFELHDLFGGSQPAEDRHFQGLGGVRVILHEAGLDSPFRSPTYPEPDYEEVGRARVALVFRDRGGDERRAPVPRGSDRLPQPVTPGI